MPRIRGEMFDRQHEAIENDDSLDPNERERLHREIELDEREMFDQEQQRERDDYFGR